ncbi:hypothetical protein GF326_05035 [Candidatus Bathyarchaeota archaeon]|nr:hypothetical protein [Candidatus Bathyarchaeota archaeon]
MKGKVKDFKTYRGYGYIESHERSGDIYFHQSNYPTYSKPEIGQQVEYKITQTSKGAEATDIKLIPKDLKKKN